MEQEKNNGRYVYQFEGFALDPARRTLKNSDDVEIPLNSRAFDTLSCLVRHAGEVVSKSTLLDTVWPETVVDENNINQAVSAVRKALKDKNKIIATVPGRGYSFIAKVEIISTGEPVATGDHPGISRPRIIIPGINAAILATSLLITFISLGFLYWDLKHADSGMSASPVSLAIFPLVESGNATGAWFNSEMIEEELVTRFTQVDDIKVSSLPLEDTPAQVAGSIPFGQRVNITHTLKGSYRIEGGNITFTIQLIDNKTDYYLWSKSYSFPLMDNAGFVMDLASMVVVDTINTLGIDKRNSSRHRRLLTSD